MRSATLLETQQGRESLPHKVDDLVLVAAKRRVLLDLSEGVPDDGEEDGHEANVDDHDVGEEEEGAEERLRRRHGLEVEGAQREGEHGLRRGDDVAVGVHHLSEEQVGAHHERREVEHEGDGEHLRGKNVHVFNEQVVSPLWQRWRIFAKKECSCIQRAGRRPPRTP